MELQLRCKARGVRPKGFLVVKIYENTTLNYLYHFTFMPITAAICH